MSGIVGKAVASLNLYTSKLVINNVCLTQKLFFADRAVEESFIIDEVGI